MIHSKDDLAQAIRHYGTLPFFTNCVPGWSVEEMCNPAVYFTDQDGSWEWKGPLASEKICVYGKFLQNKAAFISPEWFPDLANYRREGYAWDERVDEDLAPYKDRMLMTYLENHVSRNNHRRSEDYEKGIEKAWIRAYAPSAERRGCGCGRIRQAHGCLFGKGVHLL